MAKGDPCVQCGRPVTRHGKRCHGCNHAYYERGDTSPTRQRIFNTSNVCAVLDCGRPRHRRSDQGRRPLCYGHYRMQYVMVSKAKVRELRAPAQAIAAARGVNPFRSKPPEVK